MNTQQKIDSIYRLNRITNECSQLKALLGRLQYRDSGYSLGISYESGDPVIIRPVNEESKKAIGKFIHDYSAACELEIQRCFEEMEELFNDTESQ